MALDAIADKLNRQIKGRYFETWVITQALTYYVRYPFSYRNLDEMVHHRANTPLKRHLNLSPFECTANPPPNGRQGMLLINMSETVMILD